MKASLPTTPSNRHQRRKSFRARLYLLLIFLWLRAWDALVLFMAARKYTPAAFQKTTPSFVWVAAAVTTILLIGAGLRQAWAKYLLAFLLLGAAFLAMAVFLPDIPASNYPKYNVYAAGAVSVAYIPAAIFLFISKGIDRLVSRDRF